MKKKSLVLSLILFLVFGAILTNEVLAADTYNTESVFDYADLLTDEEEEVFREFSEGYEKYDISVIFLTTNDAEGKSAQTYSDDFYDNNNFRTDGVLFMIDMDNREIYINTVEKCIDMISDNQIYQALDEAYVYATEGEYNLCLTRMSKSICKIIDGKQNPIATALKPSPVTILAMLGVTAMVVVVLVVKHNWANKKTLGKNYIGSTFRVKNRDTVYMGCRKEVIPNYYAKPSDSGGGGSSRHRSSSGVAHGGGGRKF